MACYKMSASNRIIFAVLIFNSLLLGDGKVFLKKLENCNSTENYFYKLNLTLKMMGDRQALDGTFVMTAPLDNSLMTTLDASILVTSKWVHLLPITERKSCDAMNKYLGEMWYDWQRNMQMIPGLCPVPKGTYRMHNALLDFDKMATLRSFPFGNLRFTITMNYKNNDVYSCIWMEVTNTN